MSQIKSLSKKELQEKHEKALRKIERLEREDKSWRRVNNNLNNGMNELRREKDERYEKLEHRHFANLEELGVTQNRLAMKEEEACLLQCFVGTLETISKNQAIALRGIGMKITIEEGE